MTKDIADHKSPSRFPIILLSLIILISALIIRIVITLSWTPEIIDDQLDYLKIATSLANGTGFKIDGVVDLYRAPFYPAFLSIIYSLTSGDPYRVMTIIQSILSALTCVIIFLIATKAWGKKTGIIAGIIAVIAPDLILYNAFLLTETLFIFLMAIIIYCLYRVGDKTVGWVTTSVLLGLAALTRPTIIFFLPFMLCWLYFKKKLRLYKLILVPVITLLVILPWTLRNYNITGAFMPLTSAAGVNVWIGNSEQATGAFRWITEDNPYLDKSLSEAEKSSRCYSEAINFVLQQPLREIRLLALKTIFFVIPAGDSYPIHNDFIRPSTMFIITGVFFEFLLFGAVGVLFSGFNKGTSLFWFYIISIYATVLIFFFLDRFRITAYVTLIPLAAAGWAYLADKNQRKRKILILTTVLGIQIALGILAFVLRPDYLDSFWKISDRIHLLIK